jgi:hypothetical protein
MALASQTVRPMPDLLLDVPWGTAADSVLARAATAGWEFLKIDDDSDYVFSTELRGQPAVVFASFGRSGLVRLEAAFAPQPANEFTYRQLTDTLLVQYGPAAVSTSGDGGLPPARGIVAAIAWPGVLMGLRRDGWISLIFTCPESSPMLPAPRGRVAFRRA